MSYRDKQYENIIMKYVGNVAIMQFNRPEALNAMNVAMGRERVEVFNYINEDPEIKVLIMTGDERAYCAGGDLAAMAGFDVEKALGSVAVNLRSQRALMNLRPVTIAAIAGYCFGGGTETILNCDLRIAADNALFALPEINVGIYPGGGATQRLIQNISICRAKEMILFGGRIDANTACDWGIVNKVVPLDKLMDTAMEWAEKLCRRPTVALGWAKQLINEAWGTPTDVGIEREGKQWAQLFNTEDQREGMRAFLEKRKPVFVGK
jgi:enoyl-CoA hydratase